MVVCNRIKSHTQFVGDIESGLMKMMLIGLGLRILSITPPAIPEVKKIIRSVTVDQCRRVARRATGYESEREVLNYMREETRRVVPEVFAD